ncbi:uncharacterized protein [Gossypium hirsutum]|uniref:Retrotransposon gag domain-containing protein n=1 Tax=Gossypium hirsutum TaxID=3635 RepID=A0A1U8KTW3_GOSHI|nr:uncharacterized protein LOC107920592 [Gossypium hirsutum]
MVPDLDEVVKEERAKAESQKQLEERCKWLEEKARAMKGVDRHPGINAKDLSLVPDLVLPYKFRMPEFEKYNGTSCPEAHTTMFYRRMMGLVGVAAKWYNQLSQNRISSWRDLVQAFMKQYSHVTDITPDRITLQNMEKKPNESFKQYAQRWREMAIQVQPPLLEKETTMLFINTLKASFATKSFVDVVMTGEMIENAIRNGRIDAGESAKMQESGTRQNNEKIQFTPISMTYKELYQSLLDAHVVAPFYLKPLQPLFPKWYDANTQCEYHAGIVGHSIENCTTFKKLVERFIQMGIVKFDNPPSTKNPLPNHTNNGVNAIDGENYCEFHHKEGHKIQECEGFRVVIQGLMDSKEIEFYKEVTKEEYICASESVSSAPKVNYPVVIISHPKNEAGVQVTPKIIIQKPAVFSYKDNKRVPWNYNCNVTIPGKESSVCPLKEDQHIGSHTRSRRRHDLTSARTEPVKGKDLAIEQKRGKAVEIEVPVNEPVKEEEAKEFLKFLKHNEYSVVE